MAQRQMGNTGWRSYRAGGRWTDWLCAAAGIWLFISGWVLGTNANRASPWDAWWVGAAIFAWGVWAIFRPFERVPVWFNILTGVWLFISPWVLGLTRWPATAWNAWAVGAFVVVLSAISLGMLRERGAQRAADRPDADRRAA